MNILKSIRNGRHAEAGDGDSPDVKLSDSSQAPEASTARVVDHEQPLVVGNGLPIKVRPEPNPNV